MELDFRDIFAQDFSLAFGVEVLLRTLVMFSVILLFLRLSGKKGVRQLTLFEVAIVIGLGSAAGDPMSNKDQPILPALVVFLTILGFYRLVTWLASRSEWMERLFEGSPLYVVEDGVFVRRDGEHDFGKDEFFAEMRQQGVSHLGQLRTAILETNGALSCYFYPDDEVRPGLPILPKEYERKSRTVPGPGRYACTCCAHTFELPGGATLCRQCGGEEWVAALDGTRTP